MKAPFFPCMLGLGLLSLFPATASDAERELKRLADQYDKAIEEATKPIKRRYWDELDQLLKKATQANDLEAALKIKQVLASLTKSAVEGTWTNDKKGSHLEFTPGGNYRTVWPGGVNEGRWKAISERDIEVTLKPDGKNEFRLSDDGKTIQRLGDGQIWVKKD